MVISELLSLDCLFDHSVHEEAGQFYSMSAKTWLISPFSQSKLPFSMVMN